MRSEPGACPFYPQRDCLGRDTILELGFSYASGLVVGVRVVPLFLSFKREVVTSEAFG